MKLDYLHDLTDGGKYPHADPDRLIRLFDFDQKQASALLKLINENVIRKEQELDLSSLDFIEPVNCTLKFRLWAENEGVEPDVNRNFVCRLTKESYRIMSDIIEFFTRLENDIAGYNWLYDPKEGRIDLLFAPAGAW